MAKAEVVNTNPEYKLTLTEKEAMALMAVCSRVGGNSETTRRGLINNIADAFRIIGFYHTNNEDIDSVRCSIWFK